MRIVLGSASGGLIAFCLLDWASFAVHGFSIATFFRLSSTLVAGLRVFWCYSCCYLEQV